MKSAYAFSIFVLHIVLTGLLCPLSFAQTFTYKKIVDSFEAIPGQPGNTFAVASQGAPGNSGSKLSFVIQPSFSSNLQLWISDTSGGSLLKLVDTTTPIPGGTGTFVEGYAHRFFGQKIVFLGIDNTTGDEGFYSVPAPGGTIIELVNQQTQKPDGSGPFGSTAFSGAPFNFDRGNEVFGVNGSVFAVPASGTPLTEPATGTQFFICETGYTGGGMGLYGSPDVSSSTIALLPSNVLGQGAIYTAPLSGFAGVTDPCAGALLKVTNATHVASINTAVPADRHLRNFSALAFANPLIDGANVVFGGAATPLKPGGSYDLAGLYGFNLMTGVLRKLVDTHTPVPGGTGNFSLFGFGGSGASISNLWTVSAGSVVFVGTDAAGKQGLYLVGAGGPISKILAVGDTLPDGRVVNGNGGGFFQPPIQPDSLRGKSLAARLDIIDPILGSGSAIYLVTW